MIAIGGSVMHQLAIMLKNQGNKVTGSDDRIFEPALTNLKNNGLLPSFEGWNPASITHDIDTVIVGMHAKKDNPELLKAQELGLNISSFPDYIYNLSKNKQRIVVAGSHGKTTVTSIIVYVLTYFNRKFDFLAGANIEGFPSVIKLSADAPIIVIEGDEYGSSPLDHTPKFLKYHHHIAVVTGIAWDHANLYPTIEDYVRQFDQFADSTPKGGKLIFPEEDTVAEVVCKKERTDVQAIAYEPLPYKVRDGKSFLVYKGKEVQVNLIGRHNMLNLSAAKNALGFIGINEEMFYEAITHFPGATKRLQLLHENSSKSIKVFSDFAHAPSKVKATVEAVREFYPKHRVVALFELHTFSSLNKSFIPEYKNSLKQADKALVYFDPHLIAERNFAPLDEKYLKDAFKRNDLVVAQSPEHIASFLDDQNTDKTIYLFMSSGNWGGFSINRFIEKL